MPSSPWHKPAGSLAAGPYALECTAEQAGWAWSSLRVVELPPDGQLDLRTAGEEILVLPLAGACTVTVAGRTHRLAGRSSPFAGASDALYLPHSTDAVLASARGGRFALAGATVGAVDAHVDVAYVPRESVAVELRGAGSCSRRVANVCFPDNVAAHRLIVCEVLTPAGNWSSYPPHKHDEERPGETELEEIYYFELAQLDGALRHTTVGGSVDSGAGVGGDADGGGDAHGGGAGRGVAFQRIYGSAERPIDVLVEVHDRDVVLVPHGWHGPTMAAPGYDLYYLNVMAGPGRRAWLACDDPAHAWVRDTWAMQEIDPRLVTGSGSHDRDRPVEQGTNGRVEHARGGGHDEV